MRKILFTVALVLLVAIGAGSVGMRAGIRYKNNDNCCRMPKMHNAILSLKEAVGLQTRSYSQILQDKWVTETIFPGVTNGYFVDVGSGDGIEDSNTKLLEEKGWRGVCIDPFPTNMETRSCQMFKEVVFSEPGRVIEFRIAAGISGITDTHGRWKDATESAPTVMLTTVTLDDILARAKAPPFIHFMSLDIEGAELEALRGFSFDRYTIGALAIEHNYELQKQNQILELLTQHGYTRTHSWHHDDFYVHERSSTGR
jgi:FkbM family methyltransferase